MYVEFHSRSAFSFLEGASLPEALALVCSQRGVPAMALLDRNGFYGAPRFHLAARQCGIKAHIGAEVSLADGGNCPLLAQSRSGYQNLCRLITTAKLRTPKDKIATVSLDKDEFEAHASGLICLTGDERGPLAHALKNGGPAAGRKLLQRLVSIFGAENVYVELQRHFNRHQESRNQAAVSLARELHLPLLATNGVCYATPAEREIADVFTCIRNKCRLDTAGRLLAQNSQRHIRSPREMACLFADLPEAIANTVELSSRLEFTLENLGYEFPRYSVPAGETMNSFLRKRTWEGARNRYLPVTERVRRQLERELGLIEKLDLAGYFLIVWDIIRYCREHDILVQGRGSAANSAVCYSLEITAVDPIAMGLLFERFLSEERGEWPDIDLDLPSGDQREQVIQYVYQLYGRRGAAMTANVCTYRSRSAAREMGKVLGFDEDSLARLSKIAGSWEWRDPEDTLEKQFTKAGLDPRHSQIAVYLDLCQRVRDLPRHLSQHSGGMVICQGQLDSVVPLEPATMPGRVVVQWDKDDCAAMGLIKVDLLGLGMMAVIKECIELVEEHYGEKVDLAHLPQDDAARDVYETIQKADTVGMFQIESRAQMASLPRNHPQRFYDLVTQVALIRPGPIVGQMTNPYLKRRQGKEPVTYPHPSLKPVLERTLGVPLFQEQLLRMAMLCANFTGGEAEELRRALGSRRSQQRMKQIEAKLRDGMARNGFAPKTQDEIVKFITSFALYGFPESHAASFALLAYASAYLKVRYLAAFTAALLNNWPMGFYSPATLVKDAQRHGLRVKPVDVTFSNWLCTLEHDDEKLSLRLGLRYVKGLSQVAGEALVRAREERSFSAISDLALRVPQLSKADFQVLARIGALNKVGQKYFQSNRHLANDLYHQPLLTEWLHEPITLDRRRPSAEAGVPNAHDFGFSALGWRGAELLRPPREGWEGRKEPLEPHRGDTLSSVVAEGMNLFAPKAPDNNPGFSPCQTVDEPWKGLHRRDALWQAQKAAQPVGPLLAGISEPDTPSPLLRMTTEERLVADYGGTGLTIDHHPMFYRRRELRARGVTTAGELAAMGDGENVLVAGLVITRQRPGTAKGFIFLSLEDETGIANAIITPDFYAANTMAVLHERFVMIEGKLQNKEKVIHVKAEKIMPLAAAKIEPRVRNFH